MQLARSMRFTLALLLFVILVSLLPGTAALADGSGNGPFPEGGSGEGTSSVLPDLFGPEFAAGAQALLLIY